MLSAVSRIDSVTVYRQGALVTRVAEFSQPEEGWPSQLRVEGLPVTILDATVRARLEFPQGGGGWAAREVRVELQPLGEFGAQADPQELAATQAEIRRLQLRLEHLEGDVARMKKLEPGRLVDENGNGPEAFPLQARRAVVGLRQKMLARWLPQRQELQKQLEVLEKKRTILAACKPVAPELGKVVRVNLRGRADAHAPALRLWLTYQVEGASWAPGYSLRFDRDYTLATLEMRAMVCQSSGEDWSQVQLRVATAGPEGSLDLPRLTGRRLGRQQAPPLPGWRPAPPDSQALLADYDGVSPTPRPAPPRFGPAPPPYLSDLQVAAVALMTLAPHTSANFFKELGPEQVQHLTLEISRLPTVAPPERQAAMEYLLGTKEDGEVVATRDPQRMLARLRAVVASGRPAAKKRPAEKRQAETQVRVQAKRRAESVVSQDVCNLMMVNSSQAGAASLECLVRESSLPPFPPPPEPARPGSVRWEPSDSQLALEALYLPGADEAGRGKLQLQTPLLACQRRFADPNVAREAARALEKALEEGRHATRLRPPSGYQVPETIDNQDWLYLGESRVDLPSDSRFRSVPLATHQLPTRLHWLVIPKVTCDVFRRAELESPAELGLPCGPVDLFVGSDYLATVQLPAVAPGELFPLDMGVEGALRVVRKASFREQTAGMMGGTLQLRHEISLEASNHLRRPVRLEVLESLPEAAEGSECKVRQESHWEERPDRDGCRCWLNLESGQRVTCQFVYVIEMPSKLELVGGNRREN